MCRLVSDREREQFRHCSHTPTCSEEKLLLSVLGLIFSTGKTYEGAGIKVKDNAAKQTHLIRNNLGIPANLKMSIIKTDWNSLLSPTSTLPPDVTFLVKNEDEDGEQRGVLRKIGAHRFLLAGVSPVFNGMFNGPMKETAEEIKVVETTFEAFDLMIKYNLPASRRGALQPQPRRVSSETF